MIEELMISILQSTNKHTLTIILYSCLSIYVIETIQNKRDRYIILGLSIYGLEVLLNFLHLEIIEHNGYKSNRDNNFDLYKLEDCRSESF